MSIIVILEGCFCESFAVPSLSVKIKAVDSKSPVPSKLLNIFSLKLTFNVALSAANSNAEMIGAFLSLS